MPRMTEQEARERQGCWLEGSRGWRATGTLVNIAAGCGMELDADDRLLLATYLDDERDEDVIIANGEVISASGAVVDQGGLADQAEEYLNTHVAPEGWTFGW